jgi:hypothetical protein
MKIQHLFTKWAVLFLLPLYFSCNSISSEDFVLRNENTDRFSIPHPYWVSLDEDGKASDRVGLVARGYTASMARKIWLFDPYPGEDGDVPAYIRFETTGENTGIYQVTTYDDGRNIHFFTGVYHPETSLLVLYEPSKAAIEKIKEWDKAAFKGSYTLKKDRVLFDAVAANEDADLILDYLKSLNSAEYFNDSLVLQGTSDRKKFENLLASAKKK